MATPTHRIPPLQRRKESPAEQAERYFAAGRFDDRCKFWLSVGNWPRDPSGYVFLARAVHEIGKAMFPNEWTGREPTTPVPRDYRRGSGSRTLSQLEMRA